MAPRDFPSLRRNADGKLWVDNGAKVNDLIYLVADGGYLCEPCANGENGSRAAEELDPECRDDDQWRVIDWDVVKDVTHCDHCGATILPADD